MSSTIMPKDASPPKSQFRKGTKSCIECINTVRKPAEAVANELGLGPTVGRQRKLRCLPNEDESQPCQNCAARGRRCVLQVHVGRTGAGSGITSRDRIAMLEGSVNQLWSAMNRMRTELGLQAATRAHEPGSVPEAESEESESSELSPINPPAHLQQLFDNAFVDTQTADANTPSASSERKSGTSLSKARARLQLLMPSKRDIRAICAPTMRWSSIYVSLFPTINMFNSMEDMLAHYDQLCGSDAPPTTLAALLLSVAITIVQQPSLSTSDLSMKDPTKWVRMVNDAVDENIVQNDSLNCTIKGIETTLLYVRLQLVKGQTRKLWLMLRRIIALSELIGLPRAAQRAYALQAAQSTAGTVEVPSLSSAATLWNSICAIDRLVGTLFNLPFGTASYDFPAPKTVVSNGAVVHQAFFTYLAVITAKVQELDEAYLTHLQEEKMIELAFRTDQELRSLSNMTPPAWWTLSPEAPLPDQVLQYWYYYFTVRTHLHLALRHGTDPKYIHSYVTCYQASRAVSQRYVTLRRQLPTGFFAGRVLDLQALTGATVLLFTSQRQSPKQGVSVHDEGGPPSAQVVREVIQMMESVADQPTGAVAKRAAPSLRALDEFLNRPERAKSKDLTLHIPMLGKISVSQHVRQQNVNPQPQVGQRQASNVQQQPLQTFATGPQIPDLSTSGFTSDDMLWSMDLMMDDFVPFTEDPYGGEQWLSYGGFCYPHQT